MKHKIAVVDDNDTYNKLITKSLEHEGFEVDSFLSSEEAYEKILSNDYSLVICDWMMPKIDGLRLLEKVNKERPTPFWFLSAAKDNTFIKKAYGLGALKISFKDNNKNELIIDISNYFLQKYTKAQSGFITEYKPSNTFKEYNLIQFPNHFELICSDEIAVGTVIGLNNEGKELFLRVEELELLENNQKSHICIVA